jgi:hypothetical protein
MNLTVELKEPAVNKKAQGDGGARHPGFSRLRAFARRLF